MKFGILDRGSDNTTVSSPKQSYSSVVSNPLLQDNYQATIIKSTTINKPKKQLTPYQQYYKEKENFRNIVQELSELYKQKKTSTQQVADMIHANKNIPKVIKTIKTTLRKHMSYKDKSNSIKKKIVTNKLKIKKLVQEIIKNKKLIPELTKSLPIIDNKIIFYNKKINTQINQCCVQMEKVPRDSWTDSWYVGVDINED